MSDRDDVTQEFGPDTGSILEELANDTEHADPYPLTTMGIAIPADEIPGAILDEMGQLVEPVSVTEENL